jgi:ABC-type microcin C transport system permease subunit YejE
VRITLEASPPARWAAKLLRPLLGELLESRDQCREAKAHILEGFVFFFLIKNLIALLGFFIRSASKGVGLSQYDPHQ